MFLKPPVTIESLMKEWSEDCAIDATSMEKELLKISSLHSKYLNIMTYHRHVIRKLEKDYKEMRGLREDYYAGHLTKEDCDARNWPYMQHTHSNPKIVRLLEVDPELSKILLKKAAHEEIVTYCETVMKSLNNRTWDLGNYVKYLQFTGGK